MRIKKTMILILFLAFANLSMTEKSNFKETENQNTVYVCGKSKIYHKSKSHSALSRCKSGITNMKESKAKDLGKRECKCRN